ncbi:hypothetical protein HDU88_000023 [Geranomyces variabilis]|nr:hypothetical protein HDU88_000023 [Geranomyces variabilis]
MGPGGIGGCEVCKPAVASLFASLWSEHVLDHAALQDTIDKYLANFQRDCSFSVIPRVAGGEINPDGLLVIGRIAKDYNLYCKISGGQRIVMFGVEKQDLPDVWEGLVAAGLETGHAYIDIENPYKALRSPHKIKCAVSGYLLRKKTAEKQVTALEKINVPPLPDLTAPASTLPAKSKWTWTALSHTCDIPADGGATITYGQTLLTIFRFATLDTYSVTQNMCPHMRAFVLSQGILATTTTGDSSSKATTPKVSCPMHKKNFSLASGKGLSDENESSLLTFDVRVADDGVVAV